jgi:N-hydroxyarylamine O-acetyltransferase
MIDLAAYLHRIQYSHSVRTDLETLRGIHHAHAVTIPYENLDVQLGRPTTTNAVAAFEKLVTQGRGGWCYEMNGVLALALQSIGFDVERISANGSTEHSHLVLLVKLQGVTYVCDVGFADGPIEPYPLIDGTFLQAGFEYRVERESDTQWRLHNHRFGLAPGFVAGGPNEVGMAATCRWLQSSMDSPFKQHVTVCIRNDNGFVSLIDRVLRHIAPDGVTRTTMNSADEYVATLRSQFNLDVPEIAALWPELCERHETYLREVALRKAKKAS